jgi:hypothetical protein
MVTGQSVALYSRLHLIVSDKAKTRWVLIMIIVNFFILHVPVTILFLGSNTRDSDRYLAAFNIYERIQLAGFFVQETIISGLYIWETAHGLKPIFAIKQAMERKVMRHLITVNILVILLDVSLLVTQYINHFQIQTTYKPVVYSIKLKMEFIVLNKLLLLAQHSQCHCADVAGEPVGDTTRPSYLECHSFEQNQPPRRLNDPGIQLHNVPETAATNAPRTGDGRNPHEPPFTLFDMTDPYCKFTSSLVSRLLLKPDRSEGSSFSWRQQHFHSRTRSHGIVDLGDP